MIHFSHYNYYRKSRQIDVSFTLLGIPHNAELSGPERDLIVEAGIQAPCEVMLYSSLLLTKTKRELRASSLCKATKRNNSCLLYKYGCGLLQKIIVFDSMCYLLIFCLKRAPMKLCEDEITHAQLNSHFYSYYPPRFVIQCVS